MGRIPCSRLKRGPWTPEEDLCLTYYIQAHGEGRWRSLSKKEGLLRSGKSCRLRWMNYLRPDVKRGHILPDEEDLILRLHRLLGNRWSLIAGRLPGRTDNDVKNYWNSHLSKKLISQGIDPRTHRPLSESEDIWWIPQEGDMQEQILRYIISKQNANPEINDKDSDCLILGHEKDQICSSMPAPEIDDKDSDCLISGHEKDQICSSMAAPEISCSPSAPTILPSNGEKVPFIKMSKSNHLDNLKQITDCSCFPYSLPPTPMGPAYANGSSYMYASFLESFIDEEIKLPEPSVGYNSVSHQSEFASLGYELWSALQSPTTHYHRSH